MSEEVVMTETVWTTATAKQLERTDWLADKWRYEAEDEPIVLIGAATELLMNAIYTYAPTEDHERVIEEVTRHCGKCCEY